MSELYRWMLLARALDEALCELNPRWFPCVGEEAVIVGSFVDLRMTDVVAPHYRDPFIVYAMRGAEIWRLAAQVLGRADGYSQGRAVPFTGPAAARVVPWVAGDLGTSVGVATGAAVALQAAVGDDVCVCTFGDGTANRGDVHEALNLAAVWKLPIVYVCQNNGWAISQPADSYLAAPIHQRAIGYGMPGALVDGQDVEAVRAVVGAAVARARRGEGPSLIEARTWRAKGHWAGDDQSYRKAEAAQTDPLGLVEARLRSGGVTEAELVAWRAEAAARVAKELELARASRAVVAADLGLGEVYR